MPGCGREAGSGHGENQIDTLAHVVLHKHGNVRNLSLGMSAEDFEISSLFKALLFQPVEEALHAEVRAFFGREVKKADARMSVSS